MVKISKYLNSKDQEVTMYKSKNYIVLSSINGLTLADAQSGDLIGGLSVEGEANEESVLKALMKLESK